jgi:micrococcal nuclease
MAVWEYRARPVRVVDGDTLDLEVDLGFTVFILVRVRLAGLDCPEVHGATRVRGIRASAETAQWVGDRDGPWPLLLRTDKGDKYGRWLGTILRGGDEVSLNQHLLTAGFAVPWNGQGQHPLQEVSGGGQV